jgi:hypothetical protein
LQSLQVLSMTVTRFFFPRKLLAIACWLGAIGVLTNVVEVNAATDIDCAPYSANDSDEFW